MKQEKKENRRVAVEILVNLFPEQRETILEVQKEKNWKFIENALTIAIDFINQIKQGI